MNVPACLPVPLAKVAWWLIQATRPMMVLSLSLSSRLSCLPAVVGSRPPPPLPLPPARPQSQSGSVAAADADPDVQAIRTLVASGAGADKVAAEVKGLSVEGGGLAGGWLGDWVGYWGGLERGGVGRWRGPRSVAGGRWAPGHLVCVCQQAGGHEEKLQGGWGGRWALGTEHEALLRWCTQECSGVVARQGRASLVVRPITLQGGHLAGGVEISYHISRHLILRPGRKGACGPPLPSRPRCRSPPPPPPSHLCTVSAAVRHR